MAASVAIFCRLLFAVGFSFHILSGEHAFTNTFGTVVLGFNETEVLALLGYPDEKGTEFRLGQYEVFEKAYQRASKSNAKNYWFWNRGRDVVYAWASMIKREWG